MRHRIRGNGVAPESRGLDGTPRRAQDVRDEKFRIHRGIADSGARQNVDGAAKHGVHGCGGRGSCHERCPA
ncbi:hypothetical protein GCM10009796_01230 [Microbacterium koreense]